MGIETNKVVIVSAPSGAGKTTLVHHLLGEFPELAFSVSACTRPRRPNEVEGKDYYFMTVDEFKNAIKKKEFIEFEMVYPGKYYGTLEREVIRLWALGKAIVFDVDVIGGINLKKYFRSKALAIFIQPPSLEVLMERLRERNTEGDDTLNERVTKAGHELSFADRFDTVLVNDDLETAKREITGKVNRFLKNS